ncbi:MAG: STAS/SEC14 domain-containing protein [Bacteroidales bacterium]|nr:STAS/SEC14 domain-containing protein [Bacteroidales bacterium]MDD3812869.1 STAS/SEC14 domain-containing protein [Bacteroidales bacterium]MDD3990168.1 STAS/SEC14 domain-containing protein [Bacteroidales bacterium]
MTNTVQVKKISDTEYIVGENKLSIIEGNIIYVISQGEQTEEIALAYVSIIKDILSSLEGKLSYLIDVNKCGKNAPEAREIWKMMSASDRTHKVATFGLNHVARVIASFVIGSYKKGNLLFFKTKEEAMKWLLK